jgi:EAL domain-containing protein (putative c-di-GMP-specific phosphodiesterase class I)
VVWLRDKLKELNKIGVSLAIDNFGRGNSSFSTFRYLPFSEIKLDPSFTQGCDSNKGNARICQSMIQIAHSFDCSAIATGIEEPEDARKITMLGCDIGQGFLFGKPMTEQQLITMVKEGRALSKSFYRPTVAARLSA